MLRGKLSQILRQVQPDRPLSLSILTSKNWTQTAAIHATPRTRLKIYHDHENHHAHEVLANSLRNYQIFKTLPVEEGHTETLPARIFDPPSSASCEPEQVFEDFKTLMLYCRDNGVNISEEQFTRFVTLFCEVCNKFSDEQLLACLALLRLHPKAVSSTTKNFCEIWNSLDVAFLRRVDNWDIQQLLLASDGWYQLGFARISEFVWNSLRKIGRKVTKMTIEEMLHSMFFCNIVRRPLIEMFEYEVNFNKLIDKMTLKEIGVMSMGFFKTQTPIRNPELLEKIFRRLIAEASSVEDITLVAILKVLRYSSKINQADLIIELLDHLAPEIERLSRLSCLHIALFGCDIQSCHEQTLELVLERFLKELNSTESDKIRLKDMERICHVISLHNYTSPKGLEKEICVKILKALENKVQESVQYPRCFACCLHYLSLCGYHNEEMLSAVLDKKFIQHAYDTNLVRARELFCLDGYVKINLKDSYTGNQLSEKNRRTMGRLLTFYIPEKNSKFKLNTTDKLLVDVKETADSYLKACTFKHIVPHYERPDIVVCYDTTKRRAIPLSPNCPDDYVGAILTRSDMLGDLVDNPNLVTIAIAVVGWNNVVRGKNRLTGSYQMKLNQLNILGHKVSLISWHEWRSIEGKMDRIDFLKRKLMPHMR